jgi:hypothetical protein
MMFYTPRPFHRSRVERKLHEILVTPGHSVRRFDFSSVVTLLALIAGSVIGCLIAVSLARHAIEK